LFWLKLYTSIHVSFLFQNEHALVAEEQDKAEESQPAPTDDKPVTPAAPAPESQNTPPKVKTPSVKVRQPPGGKSSGPLW